MNPFCPRCRRLMQKKSLLTRPKVNARGRAMYWVCICGIKFKVGSEIIK